jgi:hypothetical protein
MKTKYFPNGYPECYPLYLDFFESEEFPNHYIVLDGFVWSDWYDRLTRQNKYSYEYLTEKQKAKGEDFGYPKIKVKKPVRIKGDQKNYFKDRFLKYLKEMDVYEHMEDSDEKFPKSWGWYKFKDALELEKWFAGFIARNDSNEKKQEEFIKVESEGGQISLF